MVNKTAVNTPLIGKEATEVAESYEVASDEKAGIKVSHHLPATTDVFFHTSLFSKHGWPGALRPRPLQAVGVANEFIQHVDNLPKFRPVASLLLPAV